MKKPILSILFILCLSFQANAWNPMVVVSGSGGAVDLCTTMGASGTYEIWLNGEYSGDPEKACVDSGTPADPTAITAGVAVAGGKINGDSGFLFDAVDELARWAATSQTIEDDGTLEFNVILPATTTHDQGLALIYTGEENHITVYFNNADSQISVVREGNNQGKVYLGNGCNVTDAQTYHIIYTWQITGTDTHSLSINGGTSYCDKDNETLDAWAGTTDLVGVGKDPIYSFTGTDGWKIDDFQIREGYEEIPSP